MTTYHLDRLIEKQEQEIARIDREINLWEQYKKEYQELKKLIDSLKDKVKHPYNIPLAGSKLALLPGNIIHTNEITVLLGDNYFALRSSKQASEIIGRRLNNVKEMLEKNEEAKKKTEDWLKVTAEQRLEKEQFVEIIETG